MATIVGWIPFASGIVSFIFAALVLRRYLARSGSHLLLWTIGMAFYGIGACCEAYYAVLGWNVLVFRLWYLFGAVLVAAWLGARARSTCWPSAAGPTRQWFCYHWAQCTV